MKRLSYLITLLLISGLLFSSNAYTMPTQQVNTCPSEPYPISNFITRDLQGILLMNWGSSQIAESIVKNQIKKMIAEGDIKVHIKPYSAMDLAAGKLKSFSVKGKNIVMNGVSISSIEAASLCDLVYIDYKNNPVTPLAPLFFRFKTTITQKDLDRTLSSKEYSDNLSSLKLKVGNADLNLIDFMNPKIKIEKNKLIVSTDMHFIGTPKFMSVPLKAGTGIAVKDNKIKLVDLQMFSDNSIMGPIPDIVEAITLSILDPNRFVKGGTEVTIKNININSGKINIEGTVWVAPK
jgi:hypothetical protein